MGFIIGIVWLGGITFILVKIVGKEKSIKAREEYCSDFIWHFNRAQAVHQDLCRMAQYYIQNEYVFDVRVYLREYTQRAAQCSWQADKFIKHCFRYDRREEWNGLLRSAWAHLGDLEAEQKKFSQVLVQCEQEEQKYKRAFSKYAPKPDVKDDYDIGDDLFRNCTDYESLHKRYKELMKLYHSDAQNGDDEMAAKINDAYERLKKKYHM